MDAIKYRLKEIRKLSIENVDNLVKKAIKNFNSMPNVKATYAEDAETASKLVMDMSGDIGTLAFNNSSTVAELIPSLLSQREFNILDTYTNDLKREEQDFLKEEASGYWDLPDSEPHLIWHSFVDNVGHMTPFQAEKISEEEFMGIVGVNAVSSEGSLFFVQHLRNIAKILSQAEKVIIVAGLEKLVESDEEALFTARSCALFGYESILSEMMCSSQDEGVSQEDTSAGNEEEKVWYNTIAPAEVHVILLDNGRKNILASEFSELLFCIGCRACTLRCPRAKCSSEGYSAAKDLLFSAFTNSLEHSAQHGLFDCTLCKGCETNCPVDIPLTSYLSILRENAISRGLSPETYTKLASNVREFGTPYGSKGIEAEKREGSR